MNSAPSSLPAARCSLPAGSSASCSLPTGSSNSASCQLPAASCHSGKGTSPKWYVLWTRSQCEQMVHEQLTERGFHLFLPTVDVWVRRKGTRHHTTVPMFPGYLFLNHLMDKKSYIDVAEARGLVKILGDSWDALAEVPDAEIATIQRIQHSGVSAVSHPYLRVGERVRIAHGLLEGVEGILIRTRPEKGLVVVSINLLQRSVAIEVDCAIVAPV